MTAIPETDLWVFAYGSLLWDPGFEPAESLHAVAPGHHRAFSLLSICHRGTPDHPGLVLALEATEGTNCTGLALRVAPRDRTRVLEELRARELVTAAYHERVIPLDLEDGRRVLAVTYVIDPAHAQYVSYPLAQQARMIASAQGGRGPNHEYLTRTCAHLCQMGINDRDMLWLVDEVARLRGADPRP